MKLFFLILTLVPSLTFAIELRRETPFPFEECDRSQYLTNMPKSTAYITEVARRIMAANPSVFRGDLAFENFCFGIRFNDAGGRAWATAESRSFVVETGMLTRVQNDAQLAFVVAHELAHVSLRHFHGGYPVSGPAITAAAAEIRRLTAQTELQENRNEEASERINSELRAQNAIINNAIAAQFGAGVIENWEEAEADRAGAQFYLNAGFTNDELAWRPQQLTITNALGLNVHSPAPEISSTERISRAYGHCNVTNPVSMTEPERGNEPYPSVCWSIWNLRHGAPATDAEYRALMNDNRSITNLGLPAESNLEAVKAEVENYIPPNPKASLKAKKSRMPASATPLKKSEVKHKNKNSRQHDSCIH